MPFLDKLHDLFVRTHLYPLVLLMLPAAQDDHDAAWIAARDTILLHDPQSEAEFRLACRLAVFSIQATHAAAQASAANLSPADSIRLRSAATTLAREADKAERQLEKRQQARPQEPVPQPAPQQPTETKPKETPKETQAETPDTPLSPTKKEELRQIAAYARKHNLTYPQAWTQYELAKKAKAAAQTGTETATQPTSA
jgi:outer membrane biosynthesis protein TonB